jgi:TetR/AcrR family tetracycline transcriptional repressor
MPPENFMTMSERRSASATISSTSSMRRSASGPAEAVQIRVEAEVLLGGQLQVQRLLLKDQADAAPDLVTLADDVEAGNPGRAGGGIADRAQHLDGRGLAGAVRAEEAVGLAGLDPELDAAHRLDGAVARAVGLGQPGDLDRGLSNGVRHRRHRPLTPLECQACFPRPRPSAPRCPARTVVDAALALLAEGGLEAVSFRRIAKALGVSGPTLYWHVENKRQLMDLMADELVRRTGRAYDGPAKGQPWWEWLRADAQRMFDALIATRDAPRVLAGNRPSPESFTDIERVLGELVSAAGMTPGQAQQTLFTIGAYVIGSATEWQAEAERASAQPLPTPPMRT